MVFSLLYNITTDTYKLTYKINTQKILRWRTTRMCCISLSKPYAIMLFGWWNYKYHFSNTKWHTKGQYLLSVMFLKLNWFQCSLASIIVFIQFNPSNLIRNICKIKATNMKVLNMFAKNYRFRNRRVWMINSVYLISLASRVKPINDFSLMKMGLKRKKYLPNTLTGPFHLFTEALQIYWHSCSIDFNSIHVTRPCRLKSYCTMLRTTFDPHRNNILARVTRTHFSFIYCRLELIDSYKGGLKKVDNVCPSVGVGK